jgi:hypothetical protein
MVMVIAPTKKAMEKPEAKEHPAEAVAEQLGSEAPEPADAPEQVEPPGADETSEPDPAPQEA